MSEPRPSEESNFDIDETPRHFPIGINDIEVLKVNQAAGP